MKEQNENGKSHTSVRNKKLYMYVALGCAAVLLAAAVIITSVALANRKHTDELNVGSSSSGNEQGGNDGPTSPSSPRPRNSALRLRP